MKYLIPVFVLFFLAFPLIIFAQYGVPIVDEPDPGDIGLGSHGTRLRDFLETINHLLYYIALGIALIVITVSGIMYMTAGADEAKATKAKKTLLYGIIGAAIVLAAGFIMDAIIEITSGI